MGSKVISFRFDDDKLALLKQHQVDGESESQAAMRLLLGVLGVEGKKPSLHIVDIVDSIKTEIKESIADGDIKEAIASSYEATMGQFNGLLEELQALKKQFEELQQIPPSAVPCSQLSITDDQLPVTNDQIPIPNDQLPDPNKNQIQNIRTTLNRKNIKVSAEQIRDAFVDAGWDGNNFNAIRKAVIELLSGAKP